MNGFVEARTFYYYRGRVALHALLRALDVRPDDEVLIPGFTCIAVPSPILGMQAKPVYVDIDARTYNMDAGQLEKRITARSRVIIAQHTYGIPCDMDAIMAIARRHNLVVIEDACHVWGSTYGGRDIGSIGAAAFYSYDPGKPFIIGMGGAAVVNDRSLCEKMVRLYGEFEFPGASDTVRLNLQYLAFWLTQQPRLFWVVRDLYRFLSRKGIAIATWNGGEFEGNLGPDYNKRLPKSLQARLAAMMLRGDEVIAQRKWLAERYARGLRGIGVPGVQSDPRYEAVMLCYPIQVTNKASLLAAARKNNVELGDWFSSPVHPLPESAWLGAGYEKGRCPVAEAAAQRTVSLPCHAGVTEREADRTVAFLAQMRARGLFAPMTGEVGGECGGATDRSPRAKLMCAVAGSRIAALKLSIIVPCRNEGRFIGGCLESILNNGYPTDDFEVLVVDGMSIDGTRETVARIAGNYPAVRLLDNPNGLTPCALNIGVDAAHGEIVMRVDAHSTIATGYIARCLAALEQTAADDVGGSWRIAPRRDHLIDRAVVRVLTHPFGVGNASYRFTEPQSPLVVDTVPYFCCRKETLRRIGRFNERLARGQDMEFNMRLRRSGGTIVLVPGATSTYYARSDVGSFLKHNFKNGMWAVLPFLYSDVVPVAPRHLVPLAFVLAICLAAAASSSYALFGYALALVLASYVIASVVASISTVRQSRDIRYLFVMPWLFAGLHLSFGFGSLAGAVLAAYRILIQGVTSAPRISTRQGKVATDYSGVTEAPGVRITREALAMHLSRYAFAVPLCAGKDVFEVACGAGTGLGYLASKGARRVVGGDYTENLTRVAAAHYGGRIPILRLDAQSLPFKSASFDVLLMYEAIYYLVDVGNFLKEAARVLRPGGRLVICTINPEWPGFNPSALSTRYWPARDLMELLNVHGFPSRIWGSFPENGARHRTVSLIKRIAGAGNLIPQTMRAKQPLKRLFLGQLGSVPNEVHDAMAPLAEAWELPDPTQARQFKVIYAVGQRAS